MKGIIFIKIKHTDRTENKLPIAFQYSSHHIQCKSVTVSLMSRLLKKRTFLLIDYVATFVLPLFISLPILNFFPPIAFLRDML